MDVKCRICSSNEKEKCNQVVEKFGNQNILSASPFELYNLHIKITYLRTSQRW